jgi:chemotaxis response regulator CheB
MLVHDGNQTLIRAMGDGTKELSEEGRFHLMAESPPIPIDTLMVMLSGVGHISYEELQAIREKGGRVVIQKPSTSMIPKSLRKLAGTDAIDAAIPPDTIAREISQYLAALESQ